MHVMYVGSVGQGKTFNAVAFAEACYGQNVIANMDVQIPGKQLQRWKSFAQVREASCGVLLIDEADMWLNSRKFAALDDTARDLIKEHRKHHLRIVTTTQHVTFVDKIFRILCDEVRIVKRISLPFIGWIWRDTVRPDIVCRICKQVRVDDGIGDRGTWWGKWFGFGTLYVWKVYPPSVLGEDESASGQETEQKEIPAIGWGWKAFSLRIARMYDTSARQSKEAHEWRLAMGKENGKL